MAGSQAWDSFAEVAERETELCPAGVQILADAAGVTLDTPIFQRGVLPDSEGISHLDFDAIMAAFPEAAAACA